MTSIGMPPLTTGSRSGSSDGPAHIILVVENDVLIRMPLAEYLRECGYRVFEAADVAEAKAVLNADTPVDLVFADANLPGEENGFMLASWAAALQAIVDLDLDELTAIVPPRGYGRN